jgi:hypothetical protein
MTNKIDINKSVPRERWGEFFDQFSDGNHGRPISIEMIGGELGDAELIQNAPLMAMIYDRPGKGDDWAYLRVVGGFNLLLMNAGKE